MKDQDREKVTVTDADATHMEEMYAMIYVCPACKQGELFADEGFLYKFCPECGVAIEWKLAKQ